MDIIAASVNFVLLRLKPLNRHTLTNLFNLHNLYFFFDKSIILMNASLKNAILKTCQILLLFKTHIKFNGQPNVPNTL